MHHDGGIPAYRRRAARYDAYFTHFYGIIICPRRLFASTLLHPRRGIAYLLHDGFEVNAQTFRCHPFRIATPWSPRSLDATSRGLHRAQILYQHHTRGAIVGADYWTYLVLGFAGAGVLFG